MIVGYELPAAEHFPEKNKNPHAAEVYATTTWGVIGH